MHVLFPPPNLEASDDALSWIMPCAFTVNGSRRGCGAILKIEPADLFQESHCFDDYAESHRKHTAHAECPCCGAAVPLLQLRQRPDLPTREQRRSAVPYR